MGIDAAKTASKRVVQKTAEPIGERIGKKIADKITLVDKTKDEMQKIHISSEKGQQIIDDLRLFYLDLVLKWKTKKLKIY